LSRASGNRRASARISDIACSDTALALTPAALASRMPALRQNLARELVGAGADRLDETEFRRDIHKVVGATGPTPPAHRTPGIARVEFIARAHLDAVDAGVSQRKSGPACG